jgi:hypothetical protein
MIKDVASWNNLALGQYDIWYPLLSLSIYFLLFLVEKDHSICLHNPLQLVWFRAFFYFPQQFNNFKKKITFFYSMLWFDGFFFFLVEKDHSICLHNLLQWRHWMQDSRITSKLIPVNLSLQIQPYLSVVDEIKKETIMQTNRLTLDYTFS